MHGCLAELESLLQRLGYLLARDGAGRSVDATHPAGRRVIFLGDLVDRGPDSPGVLRLAMGMVKSGNAFAVPGNHEHKLVRALQGAKVQVSHGLAQTLEQLSGESEEFRQEVEQWCYDLVSHLVLDDGRLVVAHAGLKEAYHGRASGRVQKLCAVRRFHRRDGRVRTAGQISMGERLPRKGDGALRPHTDSGTGMGQQHAVPGHRLRVRRIADGAAVPGEGDSSRCRPSRSGTSRSSPSWRLTMPTSAVDVAARDPQELTIDDVLGRRVIDTAHHGRITIREDSAAGALEVMSRFALHPRWLPYLPPTMAPVATATDGDLLERPAEAFAAYRAAGVTSVICEEKHMGSRAVVVICRDPDVAGARFGATAGETGAVYTRTGRPFFARDLTEQLLGRLRAAVSAAGLWDELETGWILLDCELLPWSAKAEDLLRDQYGSVGAAARSALPAALDGLRAAAASGIDVTELLARTQSRQANAEAFTAAYRRYRWPVAGLDGVRIAPFQVLATDRTALLRSPARLASRHRRPAGGGRARPGAADRTDHRADRFGGLGRGRHGLVARAHRRPAARGWWSSRWRTSPAASRGLVQPGIKVRGREYLRIIYGPDYSEPANLERLRQRNLGHKQSLALREYALGLEALDRLVHDEPLWRVHEAVFAVLAMEAEPVDPRL